MSSFYQPSDGPTLGEKNNNLFNIRFSPANEWLGQTGENKGFAVFSERIYGTRAADRLLANYGAKGFNTINDVINRFAPPTENDTQNYINSIVQDTGYDPYQSLDLSDRNVRLPILKAMAKMETGVILDDRDIIAAQNFNSNQTLNEPFSRDFLSGISFDESLKRFSQGIGSQDEEAVDNGLISLSQFNPENPDPFISVSEQDDFVTRGKRSFGELYSDALYSGSVSADSLVDQVKAVGNALIGNEEGVEANLKQAELNELRASQALLGVPEFSEFLDEPTIGGFVEQVLKFSGQSVPFAVETIATSLVTGGVGILGAGALTVGGKGALKSLLKRAVEKVARKETLTPDEEKVLQETYDGFKAFKLGPGFKKGAIAGAFGTSYKYGVGESAAEFDEAGIDLTVDRGLQSLALGVPRALIETGGQALLVRSVANLALREAKKSGSSTLAQFAKDLSGQIGRSAATEGTTEFLQDSIGVAQRFAIDPTYTREQALLRLGESAFAGAAGGLTFGAPTGIAGASVRAAKQSRVIAKSKAYINEVRARQVEANILNEETNPSGFSQPEPLNDLEAQIQAAANAVYEPNSENINQIQGGKPGVWIDQSSIDASRNQGFDQGLPPSLRSFNLDSNQIQEIEVKNLNGDTVKMYAQRVRGEAENQGIIVSRSPNIVDGVVRQGASEGSLATALGFTGTKPAPADSAGVVKVVSNDGSITYSSQEVTEAERETALGKAREISETIPNSKVEVISTRDELTSRKIKVEGGRIDRGVGIDLDESDLTGDIEQTEAQAATQAGLTVSEDRFTGLPLDREVVGEPEGFAPLRPNDERFSPIREVNPSAENSLQNLFDLIDNYITDERLASRIKENYREFAPRMTGSIYRNLSNFLSNQTPLSPIATDIAQDIPAADDPSIVNRDIDEVLPPEDTTGAPVFTLEETDNGRIQIVKQSLRRSPEENLAQQIEAEVNRAVREMVETSASNQRQGRTTPFSLDRVDYSSAGAVDPNTGEITFGVSSSFLPNISIKTIMNLGKKINQLTEESLLGDTLTPRQQLLLGLKTGFRELQAIGLELKVNGLNYTSLDQLFKVAIVNNVDVTNYSKEEKTALKKALDFSVAKNTTLEDVLKTADPIPVASKTADLKLENDIQQKLDNLLFRVRTTLPKVAKQIRQIDAELSNLIETTDRKLTTADYLRIDQLRNERYVLERNFNYIKQTGLEEVANIKNIMRNNQDVKNIAVNQAREKLLNNMGDNLASIEGAEDIAIARERAQVRAAQQRSKEVGDPEGSAVVADRITFGDTVANAFNNRDVTSKTPRKPINRPIVLDNAIGAGFKSFMTRALTKLKLTGPVKIIDVSSLRDNVDKYVDEKILNNSTRAKQIQERKDKLTLDRDAALEDIENDTTLNPTKRRENREKVVNKFNEDIRNLESKVDTEWQTSLKNRLESIIEDSTDSPAQVLQMGNQSLIVTNKALSKSAAVQLASIAHEIGHIFFQQEFNSIITSTDPRQERLRGLLYEQFLRDRQGLGNPEQYRPGSYKNNAKVRAFEEWYADNVASFILDDAKRATNATESYFRKIARILKTFFKEINKAFNGRIFEIPQTMTIQEDNVNKTVNIKSFMQDKLNEAAKQNIDVDDFDAVFQNSSQTVKDNVLFRYHMMQVIKRQNAFIRKTTIDSNKSQATTGDLFARAIAMDKVKSAIGTIFPKKFKKSVESLLNSGAMKTFSKHLNTVNNWYRSSYGAVGAEIARFWLPRSQSRERSGISKQQFGFHRAVNIEKNRFINELSKKLNIDLTEEKDFTEGPVNDAFILAEDETLDTDKIVETVRQNPRLIKRIDTILSKPENSNLSLDDVRKEAVAIAKKAVQIRNFFSETIFENYISYKENGETKRYFDIGRRENYAPRTWDWQAVEANQEPFIDILIEYIPEITNEAEARDLIKQFIEKSNEHDNVTQFVTQEKDSIPQEWLNTYERYKTFVEENQRLPTGELSAWGEKQLNDLVKGKLPNQEAIDLLEQIPGFMTRFGFSPGMKASLARKLGQIPTKVLREQNYLYAGGVAAVQYLHHVTRKVEFEKRGGYAYLESLLKQIPIEEQERVRESFRGQLGQWGANMKPWMRTVNSISALHTITTTLLFVTISSLTDPAGTILRGKELSLKNFSNFFSQIKHSWTEEENLKLAKAIGVVSAEALDTLFISVGELDYANKWARTGIQAFFKWNLTTWYTRFTRIFATGMAREFIIDTTNNYENAADGSVAKARYQRYLEELGLTPEDGARFKKFVESNDPDAIAEFAASDQKIRQALATFADESIIRPNPGERPNFANHPYAAIIWMLKSYFYSFGTTVLGGMGREFKNRYAEDGHFKNGALLAVLAGSTLLPLAMIGLELRELTKYVLQAVSPFHDASGRVFRSDYMDSAEYAVDITDRAGLFGPWSLLIQMIESFQYGATEPIAAVVPIYDAFDDTVIDGDANRPWPVFNNIQ